MLLKENIQKYFAEFPRRVTMSTHDDAKTNFYALKR